MDSIKSKTNKQTEFDFSEGTDYINIQKLIKKKKELNDYFLFKIREK